MRRRNVIAASVLTALAVVTAGCSKDQVVKDLILGGKEVLQLLGCVVLLVVVVTSWVHHKVTGVLVTSVVIIGFVCYVYATRKPYIEPTIEQPHAEIRFLVISSPVCIPVYTVWLDDCDIAFRKRRIASRGGLAGTLSGEGEYAVRVSAGDHVITVSYSALDPGVVSNTREDLRFQVKCSAGETLFLVLSSLGGSVMLMQVTDREYATWVAYKSANRTQIPPELIQRLTGRLPAK